MLIQVSGCLLRLLNEAIFYQYIVIGFDNSMDVAMLHQMNCFIQGIRDIRWNRR